MEPTARGQGEECCLVAVENLKKGRCVSVFCVLRRGNAAASIDRFPEVPYPLDRLF
jgi:hypothetical protein